MNESSGQFNNTVYYCGHFTDIWMCLVEGLVETTMKRFISIYWWCVRDWLYDMPKDWGEGGISHQHVHNFFKDTP